MSAASLLGDEILIHFDNHSRMLLRLEIIGSMALTNFQVFWLSDSEPIVTINVLVREALKQSLTS